jgi:hypothetical protein
MDLSGSGQILMVGFCEHSNKPSDSIKGGEFLNELSFSRTLICGVHYLVIQDWHERQKLNKPKVYMFWISKAD